MVCASLLMRKVPSSFLCSILLSIKQALTAHIISGLFTLHDTFSGFILALKIDFVGQTKPGFQK